METTQVINHHYHTLQRYSRNITTTTFQNAHASYQAIFDPN
jgi:hypothetical protein